MHLIYRAGASNKFWTGSVDGTTLRVHFGRVGTKGQRQQKSLPTAHAAERELARLIAEKLRKGYAPVEEPPSAAAPAPPARPGAPERGARPALPAELENAPLLELARRLGADATVLEEVGLAMTAPAAYIERFARRLDQRGVVAPRADLAWLSLIDGLRARGSLAELDHKASADEVLEAVFALDPEKKRAAWRGFAGQCTSEEDYPETSAQHCLQIADLRLRARQLTLVYLSIASDSTPIVVVPVADVETLEQLARAAGLGELGPIGGHPAPPVARLELPRAPAATPTLSALGSVALDVPWAAVRGFVALPGGRAALLSGWGSERRWRLWWLSASGVQSQPIDASVFPEWERRPRVEHFCALFRAGNRFGLMSDEQFRCWDESGAPPVLGRLAPALFRGPRHRPPNLSFGGASDDPSVVVACYFEVGSLETSPFVARFELDLERGELRHQWLQAGRPLQPRRPRANDTARVPSADPFPPLLGIGHGQGSTFIVARGFAPPTLHHGYLASVRGDGSSDVLLSLPAPGRLRLTSCGRFAIVTAGAGAEGAEEGRAQALYGLRERQYVFPFDPEGLPPGQRWLDTDSDVCWAFDAARERVELHLYALHAPGA